MPWGQSAATEALGALVGAVSAWIYWAVFVGKTPDRKARRLAAAPLQLSGEGASRQAGQVQLHQTHDDEGS